MKMKYCTGPVVVAPRGMALGGGCECVMHGAAVRAAAESYMGLVELGVGLVPAGGGCKEMAVRHYGSLPHGVRADLFPFMEKVFTTIGMAKVSTSAEEARQYGFLKPTDTPVAEPRGAAGRRQGRRPGPGGHGLPAAAGADGAGARRRRHRRPQDRHPHHEDGWLSDRVRPAPGSQAGPHHLRRGRARQHRVERAATARPGTGGLPEPLRRSSEPSTASCTCWKRASRYGTERAKRSRAMSTGVVVTHAYRTAVGRSGRGTLRHTRPDELLALLIQGFLAKVPSSTRRSSTTWSSAAPSPRPSRA